MSKTIAITIMACCLVAVCIAGHACQPTVPAPNTPMPEPAPDSTRLPEPGPTATPTPNPAATPSPAPAPKPVTTVSVEELKQKLERGDSLVLVDVRPKTSFDRAHIEGAISIPLQEMTERYGEIPQDPEVIVYAECA